MQREAREDPRYRKEEGTRVCVCVCVCVCVRACSYVWTHNMRVLQTCE